MHSHLGEEGWNVLSAVAQLAGGADAVPVRLADIADYSGLTAAEVHDIARQLKRNGLLYPTSSEEHLAPTSEGLAELQRDDRGSASRDA